MEDLVEDIVLEKTAKTPAIHFSFNDNLLEITGVSIPEDADSFYAPLMEWVDKYIEKKVNQPTTIILKLIYFNTSTSDYLVTMLKNLKKVDPQYHSEKVNPADALNEEGLKEEVQQLSQQELEEEIKDIANVAINENGTHSTAAEEESENKPERLLRIEWHYEEEDEDMRETGSHFESIIDQPFIFEACEEIE